MSDVLEKIQNMQLRWKNLLIPALLQYVEMTKEKLPLEEIEFDDDDEGVYYS